MATVLLESVNKRFPDGTQAVTDVSIEIAGWGPDAISGACPDTFSNARSGTRPDAISDACPNAIPNARPDAVSDAGALDALLRVLERADRGHVRELRRPLLLVERGMRRGRRRV